jgi:hypothetical protein
MPNNKIVVVKKKGKKKSNFQGHEVSANVMSYRGPLRTPASKTQMDLHTMSCHFINSTWSSDGSGVMSATYSDDPSISTDWSSLAASFEEYRTLAHEIQYVPNNKYQRGSTTTRPICLVDDRANNAAMTSYANAAEHASITLASLDEPFRKKINMDGSDEAVFQKTSAPVSTRWIKIYASGLSASTMYGVFMITYLVQFRGKA